ARGRPTSGLRYAGLKPLNPSATANGLQINLRIISWTPGVHALPPMTLLEGLKRHTTIVADTGDLAAIERLRPRDATTNPSLILKAAQQPPYRPLVEAAVRSASDEDAGRQLDHVLVAFGARIVELVGGRVSTEVDA